MNGVAVGDGPLQLLEDHEATELAAETACVMAVKQLGGGVVALGHGKPKPRVLVNRGEVDVESPDESCREIAVRDAAVGVGHRDQ